MTRTVLEAEGKHYAVQKASIIQKLNTHAFLKTFFLCGEDTNRISCYSPVCLKECPDQPDQEKVLFCGIVTGMVRYQEEGRDYMELTAASGSILADLQRRECSFQQESRTYGELFRLILEKYPGGAYIWNGEEKHQKTGRMFFQYQESDWEFLRRLASIHGLPLIPETLVSGTKLYIGLLRGREEIELTGECEQFHMELSGCRYHLGKSAQKVELGTIVRYRGKRLAVAEAEAYLENTEWEYHYVLKSRDGCRNGMEKNRRLQGMAVDGNAVDSRSGKLRMRLRTDCAGEQRESWHEQPTYYAGKGSGYEGSPEPEDVLKLYFPSGDETERYVIAAVDCGNEERPERKSLKTPGGLGSVLDGTGVWLHSKGRRALVKVEPQAIRLRSKGEIYLNAGNISEAAGEITLQAEQYLWLHNGENGILITEDQIQMKDNEIRIFSPHNGKYDLLGADRINRLLSAYEEMRENENEFFHADGMLHRVDEPDTLEGRNIEKVLKYIRDVVPEDKIQGNLVVENYHTYSRAEIRYLRRVDLAVAFMAEKVPEVGWILGIVTTMKDEDLYGEEPGFLNRTLAEGIPKTTAVNLGKQAEEDMLMKELEMATGGAVYHYKGWGDDIDTISKIMDKNIEFRGGDVYAQQYAPNMKESVNYKGTDIYYIKPGDIEINILDKVENENVGGYVVFLSGGEGSGDPMEIQAVWYFKY